MPRRLVSHACFDVFPLVTLHTFCPETRAEGMVRIREVGNDYFTYDEKRYRLVGERTKVQYALGDPIRVKLIAARVAEKELDFGLAEKE